MTEILTITLKLILAMSLGWIIGLEREMSGKEAGTRTHALITFGSALFTIIAVYGFEGLPNVDPTRIIGQILVGIGFIGAGLIVFEKHRVEGLTTAASLWAISALGVTVGIGWYWISIISALLMLILLFVVGHLEYHYLKKNNTLWSILDKKRKKKWWL